MSKKYYSVRIGREPGIYLTWDDCKAQVDKFPGAIYKSFKTMEEAEKFAGLKATVTEKVKSTTSTRSTKTVAKTTELKPIRSTAKVKVFENYIEPLEIKDNFDMIAFVDGSYEKFSKTYGSGIAVLDLEKDIVEEHKEAGIDKWDQWNIVGEVEASKYAIKLAKEKGMKRLCIYHDLKNLSLWASGSWQAKNEYTQDYVRYIEEYSKDVDITFVKVKGHSANRYNDIADRLAREAIEEY